MLRSCVHRCFSRHDNFVRWILFMVGNCFSRYDNICRLFKFMAFRVFKFMAFRVLKLCHGGLSEQPHPQQDNVNTTAQQRHRSMHSYLRIIPPPSSPIRTFLISSAVDVQIFFWEPRTSCLTPVAQLVLDPDSESTAGAARWSFPAMWDSLTFNS